MNKINQSLNSVRKLFTACGDAQDPPSPDQRRDQQPRYLNRTLDSDPTVQPVIPKTKTSSMAFTEPSTEKSVTVDRHTKAAIIQHPAVFILREVYEKVCIRETRDQKVCIPETRDQIEPDAPLIELPKELLDEGYRLTQDTSQPIATGGYKHVYKINSITSNKTYVLKTPRHGQELHNKNIQIQENLYKKDRVHFVEVVKSSSDSANNQTLYLIEPWLTTFKSLHKKSDNHLDCPLCLDQVQRYTAFKEMLASTLSMHNEGYIHNDIKPDNFLVDLDSNPISVKQMDFDRTFSGVENFENILENRKQIGGFTQLFGSVNYCNQDFDNPWYNDYVAVWLSYIYLILNKNLTTTYINKLFKTNEADHLDLAQSLLADVLREKKQQGDPIVSKSSKSIEERYMKVSGDVFSKIMLAGGQSSRIMLQKFFWNFLKDNLLNELLGETGIEKQEIELILFFYRNLDQKMTKEKIQEFIKNFICIIDEYSKPQSIP